MKLKLCLVTCLCWLCLANVAQAQIVFDRPKNTEPLPTPYTIGATREKILAAARSMLDACKIPYQEKSPQGMVVKDRIVTDYIVFTRGVNTGTNLAHYSNPPANEVRAWTAGRVYLEIIALPFDTTRSQISIVSHFQGRTAGVLTAGEEEWIDCPSNLRLEDEVLRALAGQILGIDLSIDGKGRRRILDCELR